MDRRKNLHHYIKKAQRSLLLEKIVPIIQYSIFFIVAVCSLILIVSRLFVFPYYRDVAFYSSITIILFTIIFIWIKRVRTKEALMKLDEYYPNNELVTSLSFKDNENPLVKSLLQKAEVASQQSFQKFKQRKKKLWRPPILISIVLTSIFLGLLLSFPSETQREAVAIEKEKEMIKELKKEIAKMEKKVNNNETKKQLQELKNKLNEVDTVEKAMREMVKKQMELKLQEQKLQKKNVENKGNGSEGQLTKEQQEMLTELGELQNALNKNLQHTKSQLSKFGKFISTDLQNEIASLQNNNMNPNQNSQNNNQNNQNSQHNSNNQGNQNNVNNQNNSNQGNQNQNNANHNNTNQNNGSGSSNAFSKNAAEGGSGAGGSGAGIGQGSRELVSIPKRIGKIDDISVDSGPLGAGNSKQQKGTVNATKNTVRSYEEVIGQYKNSYFESSERMQLPKDLQLIVQSYFSSIEDD